MAINPKRKKITAEDCKKCSLYGHCDYILYAICTEFENGQKWFGQRRRKMIKAVIRCQNNMVMVFDEEGEQIPEYQGQYNEVKEKILKDIPLSAVFCYLPDYETELEIVPREEW